MPMLTLNFYIAILPPMIALHFHCCSQGREIDENPCIFWQNNSSICLFVSFFLTSRVPFLYYIELSIASSPLFSHVNVMLGFFSILFVCFFLLDAYISCGFALMISSEVSTPLVFGIVFSWNIVSFSRNNQSFNDPIDHVLIH